MLVHVPGFLPKDPKKKGGEKLSVQSVRCCRSCPPRPEGGHKECNSWRHLLRVHCEAPHDMNVTHLSWDGATHLALAECLVKTKQACARILGGLTRNPCLARSLLQVFFGPQNHGRLRSKTLPRECLEWSFFFANKDSCSASKLAFTKVMSTKWSSGVRGSVKRFEQIVLPRTRYCSLKKEAQKTGSSVGFGVVSVFLLRLCFSWQILLCVYVCMRALCAGHELFCPTFPSVKNSCVSVLCDLVKAD